MEFEYKNNRFVYDQLTKNIYMDGVKIWHDDENQVGDPDYYETFEDWVIDNYFDNIIFWLGVAGYDKFNTLPDDLRAFIIESDIYQVDINGIVSCDGKYVNADDIREQMDYIRDIDTFEE